LQIKNFVIINSIYRKFQLHIPLLEIKAGMLIAITGQVVEELTSFFVSSDTTELCVILYSGRQRKEYVH
jgi:hypothetical protein